MAVMIPEVVATGDIDAGGTSSVVTTSFTPPANGLLFVLASIRQGGGNDRRPVSITGHGLTWTLLGSLHEFGSGSPQTIDTELYVAEVGASPSAGTLTATWTGGGFSLMTTVIAVAGQEPTTPLPQATVSATVDTAVDGSGDVSLSLGAVPGADSTVIGFASTGSVSVGLDPASADFTEFYDFNVSTSLRHQAMYNQGSAGTDVVWTAVDRRVIFFAVEVAAAPAGQNLVGQVVVSEIALNSHGWAVVSGAAVEL